MPGLSTMLPKSKPKPLTLMAQLRATIQNTLEMKDAGFTNKEIMASFDKGMKVGKKKAEEVKRA